MIAHHPQAQTLPPEPCARYQLTQLIKTIAAESGMDALQVPDELWAAAYLTTQHVGTSGREYYKRWVRSRHVAIRSLDLGGNFTAASDNDPDEQYEGRVKGTHHCSCGDFASQVSPASWPCKHILAAWTHLQIRTLGHYLSQRAAA